MLHPCSSCGCLVRAGDPRCPTCDTPVSAGRARSGAALLLGLTLVATGCPPGKQDSGVQALYGVVDTHAHEDNDEDGWTPAEGDCDDGDPAVYPDAEETPGDELDSNCDGADDT